MQLNLGIACFAFTASRFGEGEDSNVQTILLRKETQREAWEMRISCLLFFGFIFWKNMKWWIAFWLVVVQVMNRKIKVSSSLWSVSEAWRHAISTWAPFTSVILNLFVSPALGKHLHQSLRKKTCPLLCGLSPKHEGMNREMKEDSNFYMGPISFCNPQPICFHWLWETSTSVHKKKKKKKKKTNLMSLVCFQLLQIPPIRQ